MAHRVIPSWDLSGAKCSRGLPQAYPPQPYPPQPSKLQEGAQALFCNDPSLLRVLEDSKAGWEWEVEGEGIWLFQTHPPSLLPQRASERRFAGIPAWSWETPCSMKWP